MSNHKQNQLFIGIIEAFLQLPYEERLIVLKQLISNLKLPKENPNKDENSLLSLAGTGQGIYKDIDTYIEKERDWD